MADNIAAFIRKHPKGKASEVVEKAKAAGLKTTINYVYAVRSGDRKKGKKSPKKLKRASVKAGQQLREVFIKLAEKIGVDEAIGMLLLMME